MQNHNVKLKAEPNPSFDNIILSFKLWLLAFIFEFFSFGGYVQNTVYLVKWRCSIR